MSNLNTLHAIDITELMTKLKQMKHIYAQDGFIICGIFGSVANGNASPNSDIDVAIELAPGYLNAHDVWCYFKTMEQIRSELSRFCKRRVDVFDLGSQSAMSHAVKKEMLRV